VFRVWLLMALVFVGACASPQPRHESFREAEFEPFSSGGKGSIEGRAFVRVTDPWEKTCLGKWEQVVLTPETSYTAEWFDREVVARQRLADEDVRLESYRRRTKTDALGRFRFDDLAPGRYLITGRVRYTVEDVFDTEGSPESEERIVFARAEVKAGDGVRRVELTR